MRPQKHQRPASARRRLAGLAAILAGAVQQMAGRRSRSCAIAVGALLVPALGMAQSPSVTSPLPPLPAAPAPESTLPAGVIGAAGQTALTTDEAAIDRRIAALRTRLGVTAAEMPLWTAFVHAIREAALSADALSQQRAGAIATMTAADNLRDNARIARAFADNAERLANAFDRLYASLSPAQRRAADAIFRQQARSAATSDP
ncbi:MAG TPA: Spy/CpxP family protein refolding chaperone [Stellaceae bacterium]|nr:Spy/CpxP family protein refolding chaperone [Stellaceae bacterium]